jgi:hypothetical protein
MHFFDCMVQLGLILNVGRCFIPIKIGRSQYRLNNGVEVIKVDLSILLFFEVLRQLIIII